ncbi:nuclear transport factor 2 family protein [Rudanella lutea]|uniref:nuclear transport factor 2 family protein n=1 Tax=Rudanella lutea TaxID=451374 RepID=UPI000378580E|nr:nuclear transport factor 2 family protein [Rudanella lutea]
MTAYETVSTYYEAFNRKDWSAMLALLHDEVRHDPNQGTPRHGKALFTEFLNHMDTCYDEQLTDMVILTPANAEGAASGRVACEFVVNGTYKATDGDLPPAQGQRYVLPAGSFIDVQNGLITRITTYYNLPLWESLVLGR